jgi:hypothetical protein
VSIWNELGIEPTTDSRAIKRAYAARLKQVHPEDDPTGFQRLRKAYEDALAHANGRPKAVAPAVPPPPEEPRPTKRAKPKVPFRARAAPHRRGSRAGPSPIIVTAGSGPQTPNEPPRGRDAVARLQNVYAERGEEAGIELLRELCKESASWSVDDRDRFALDLAKWLGSFEPVRWPLLMAADEHFHWSQWVDEALAGRLDPPIRKVVEHLQRRAALERFRSDLLSNQWTEKRRRMVQLLLIPFDAEALAAERAKLSWWARATSFEEFRQFAEELEDEYGSLDDLDIDPRTVEYWTREPKKTSKGLWRGSIGVAAVLTIVFMVALAVLRAFDVAPGGLYPWWAESLWVLAVLTTLFQTWLNDDWRTVAGLVCASLTWPEYTLIPSFTPFLIFVSFGAMWAAVGLPRATTYVLLGAAAGFEINTIAFAWAGEGLRWLFGLRPGAELGTRFDRVAKPALVYTILVATFAGAVYSETLWWARVLFIIGWIAFAEGLRWYMRNVVNRE